MQKQIMGNDAKSTSIHPRRQQKSLSNFSLVRQASILEKTLRAILPRRNHRPSHSTL